MTKYWKSFIFGYLIPVLLIVFIWIIMANTGVRRMEMGQAIREINRLNAELEVCKGAQCPQCPACPPACVPCPYSYEKEHLLLKSQVDRLLQEHSRLRKYFK